MSDAFEDFVERRSASLVHEPGQEVLLEGLAGSAGPSPQDGVDVLGDILDLDAGHAVSVAPLWRLYMQSACKQGQDALTLGEPAGSVAIAATALRKPASVVLVHRTD
jgi:hypothetical protein